MGGGGKGGMGGCGEEREGGKGGVDDVQGRVLGSGFESRISEFRQLMA